MQRILPILLVGAVFSILAGGCTREAKVESAPAIIDQGPIVPLAIKTSLGVIQVEINVQQAPVTARNFLKYVDGGYFDGGIFHRTVTRENQGDAPIKIEVIQGSITPNRPGPGYPAIPLEPTSKTGLRHLDGTLSMARDEPDSATSDFFICIGDQPELDFGGKRNPDGQGFGAFGRATAGLDVVKQIQGSPAQGQSLEPPVKILTIRRLKSR